MNTAPDTLVSEVTTPGPGADAAAIDLALPPQSRLSHLFRSSMKSGRVHPLYRPMLSYRQAADAE